MENNSQEIIPDPVRAITPNEGFKLSQLMQYVILIALKEFQKAEMNDPVLDVAETEELQNVITIFGKSTCIINTK